jgi:hypothetical protein
VASLLARRPLRRKPLLLLINKLASLTFFVVLLAAGWMVVSYLRAERAARWNISVDQQNRLPANTPNATIVRLASADQTDEGKQPVQKLIYSCSSDREYYHASTHQLALRCERIAQTQEAALQRGLKPCPKCIPRDTKK